MHEIRDVLIIEKHHIVYQNTIESSNFHQNTLFHEYHVDPRTKVNLLNVLYKKQYNILVAQIMKIYIGKYKSFQFTLFD